MLCQENGKTGAIQKIHRDTPRAISTWIYIPSRYNVDPPYYRYFICLDTLKPSEISRRHTHRISIWKAGAWGDIDDDAFSADQLYTALYDLSLHNQNADHWGQLVIRNLAKSLLSIGIDNFGNNPELAWENQIRLSIVAVIGSYRQRSDWKPWLDWCDWP